ncbi:MAG: ABC transporter substrate-binding protein [Eubacteriales bacterium]
MKKNKLHLAPYLLALSLLLTSCSSDSGTTPSDSTPTTTPETTQTDDVVVTPVASFPVTFTDQGGHDVTIEEAPLNIAMAGLPPFSSFFIQFTGNTDLIACMPGGSLTYPDWIERVFPDYSNIHLEGMGPNYEVEAILALEPDLIICTTGMEENYQIFRETGIPTVGLSSTADGIVTVSTANGWITLLGDIFGETEKAAAIVENNNRLLALVEEHSGAVETQLSGIMLPDYSENIIEISNNDYYGGYWLATSGMDNVAKDVVGWETNMEEVIAFDPEVIYLSAFSAYEPSDLLNDTAVAGHSWSATTAGQNGAIYKFPVGLFNWYALSPDAAISMLWIASNAYPEQFADVDLNAEIKTHYSLFGIDLTDAEVENLLEQR